MLKIPLHKCISCTKMTCVWLRTVCLPGSSKTEKGVPLNSKKRSQHFSFVVVDDDIIFQKYILLFYLNV